MHNRLTKNNLLFACGSAMMLSRVATAQPDGEVRIGTVRPIRVIFHNEQGGLRPVIDPSEIGFNCENAAGVWFTGVGGVGQNAVSSTVTGVSPDGTVIVGWSLALHSEPGVGYAPIPFTWTPCGGGNAILDQMTGTTGGQALGVSTAGQVVVGIGRSESYTGYRLFAENAADLVIDEGSGLDTSLNAVSADGSVVVGSATDEIGSQALVFVNGWDHIRSLGDLLDGTSWSNAYGVSADGSVIVGQSMSANGPQAFIWTGNTGMLGLGDFAGGSFDSIASAVSANGRVVIGAGTTASGREAFRWTVETGLVSLGDLPGGANDSEALAVSADGSVIVGRASTQFGPTAFIWDAQHGMRNLNEVIATRVGYDLSDWNLIAANGVSGDGSVIAGSSVNPYGNTEGWVAHMPVQRCNADWNNDGVANSLDFFNFLTDFFSNSADVNHDTITDTRDFFEFLAAFFTGCP